MRKHVKAVHNGIKDIACTHEGCDKMFSRAEGMRQHLKSVHDRMKDISCTHEGCTKMFSQAENMSKQCTKASRTLHVHLKDVHRCLRPNRACRHTMNHGTPKTSCRENILSQPSCVQAMSLTPLCTALTCFRMCVYSSVWV